MTARTAAPAVTGQEIEQALAELALLRCLLDQTSGEDVAVFELMRRQFARAGSLCDALAETQAGDREMTAALHRLASHRQVAP